MVGLQPQGPFCDAGAPVVDDQGVLVAIGGPPATTGGGVITQLIDTRAVKATLQELAMQE
jgi:hypothetical protein